MPVQAVNVSADGAGKPAWGLLNSAPSVKRGSGRFSRAGVGSMRGLSSLYASDNNNNLRTENLEQLSSRYRVVKTLASGISTVEVVRRQDDARLLVLKVCKQSEAASRELTLLRSLRHASIVRVHDFFLLESSGASPTRLCLVMDYAAGGDLQQLINRLRDGREAAKAAGQPAAQGLHDEQCTRILVQLISAVEHCHAKGVVHRDIKPANIFLARAPNAASLVFLGDFGISAQLPTAGVPAEQSNDGQGRGDGIGGGEASSSSPNQLAGTPYYLAPELLTGAAFSPKSDVWSIGICLYQMLTLELPFVGRTLPQLAVKIQSGLYETPRGRSAELLHVLRTCLTLAPAARGDAHAILILPAFVEWHRYYAARRLRDTADYYLSPQMYMPPTRTTAPHKWLKSKAGAGAATREEHAGESPERAKRSPSGLFGKALAVGHELVTSPIRSSSFSPRGLVVRTASCASEEDAAAGFRPQGSPLPLEKEAAVLEMRECLNCLQELAQGEWLESDRDVEGSEHRNCGSSPSRLARWGRSHSSLSKSSSPEPTDCKQDNNARDGVDRRFGASGWVSWVDMEKEVYVQPYTPEAGKRRFAGSSHDAAGDGALFELGVAVFVCNHNGQLGRLYVTGVHVIFQPLLGHSRRADGTNARSKGRIVLPIHLIQCLIKSGSRATELTLMLAPAAMSGDYKMDGPPPTKAFRMLMSSSRQAAIDAIVAAVAAHGLRLSVYTRRNSSPQRLRQALDSYQAGRFAPEHIRTSFEKLWQRSGLSDISSRMSSATPTFRGSIRRMSRTSIQGTSARGHGSPVSRASATPSATVTVEEEAGNDGDNWSDEDDQANEGENRV